MALVTAKTSTVSAAVLSGTLRLPPRGVPTYDIIIDQPDGTGFDAGTQVTIECADGISCVGTVPNDRAGDFLQAVHVRVIGGKNGMWKTARARGYMQPGALFRDVVDGLLKDAGETLSNKSDQKILSTNLTSWMTTDRSVAANLDVLLKFAAPTAIWRILADGTVFIGPETWPQSNDAYAMLRQEPIDGHYELGVETPTLIPGVNLTTTGAVGFSPTIGNIARVEHVITPEGVRSLVWSEFDAMRGPEEAIRDMVDHVSAAFDFAKVYDVTVKSQSGDLTTLDVNPPQGLTEIGGLQRVPFLQPWPGCKVQVANGITVLLGWYRGDPRMPYAALSPVSDASNVTRIQLGGNVDGARKGDHSDVGTLSLTVAGGGGSPATLVGSYTDPDGNVTPVAGNSITATLKAKLTEGSSKVGLG